MKVRHNIDEVADRVEDRARKARRAVAEAVDGDALVASARRVTPVGDTGRLRAAWTFRADPDGGALHNPTRYAGYQDGLAARAKSAALSEIRARKGTIAREVSDG